MANRRKSKSISQEDQKEIEDFFDKTKETNPLVLKNTISIKCKTEGQKNLINSIKNNEITICSGLAGTGKTYLACAQALNLLKNSSFYEKIIIVKSVTTLRDEEIGFLKGTIEEKMEPFIYSFIHNFEKITSKSTVRTLRSEGLIEAFPIAYMRGINIDNSIVIVDEAQNISIDNIRTILTRLGKNSKMIFLGDSKQIDRKRKSDSALDFIIDNFTDISGFGLVRLGEEDVIRNPIIKLIENRFNEINY